MGRPEIVEAARELLGTPFHHQGRAPGVGVDCVGLLVCVARALSLPHQDCRTYRRRPEGDRLEHELAAAGLLRLEPEEAQVGDALAFWIRRRRDVQHAGIMTDVGLLHTWAATGKVVEHGMNDFWRARTSSAWRFPEAP